MYSGTYMHGPYRCVVVRSALPPSQVSHFEMKGVCVGKVCTDNKDKINSEPWEIMSISAATSEIRRKKVVRNVKNTDLCDCFAVVQASNQARTHRTFAGDLALDTRGTPCWPL